MIEFKHPLFVNTLICWSDESTDPLRQLEELEELAEEDIQKRVTESRQKANCSILRHNSSMESAVRIGNVFIYYSR